MRNIPIIAVTLCVFVACTTEGDDAARRRWPRHKPDAAQVIDAGHGPANDGGSGPANDGGSGPANDGGSGPANDGGSGPANDGGSGPANDGGSGPANDGGSGPANDGGSGPAIDAGSSGSGSGSISGGTVSCYREGAPNAFCTIPSHCCFTNYGAQHNGACGTSACAWGTIECDGPEDCASGERCCSRAIVDSNGSTVGYRMSCSSGACGGPPLGDELCHPNGAACGNGGSCVTAYGNQTDLPRSLYICR